MLVITAILMTVMLGFAALAIDIGSFEQAQRQAQAAADAAALAGADSLVTSSTNTTAATNQAKTYAAENEGGLTSPNANVSASTTAVTVTVTGTTPSFFGRIFGVTSETVSARAVAGVDASLSTCEGTPSASCYAIFAKSTACPAVTIHDNADIEGGIWSNGGVSASNDTLGGTLNDNGCTTLKHSTPAGAENDSDGGTAGWPLDWSQYPYYPACSTSGPIYCTGPSGTPSYCTTVYTAASYSLNAPPTTGVACYPGTGTGVKYSDPSTWTGSVGIGTGGFSETASSGVTFICGTWTGGKGGITLYPASGTKLLIYAASSGGAELGTGGGTYNGDIFAPTGPINVDQGGNSSQFLEGQTVSVNQGDAVITGDGPPSGGGTGGSTSATASLLQ